jgi:hypothetical protein
MREREREREKKHWPVYRRTRERWREATIFFGLLLQVDWAIGTCLGISVTPMLDCRMAPWPKQQTAVAMRQMGDELDGPQRGSQSVKREDMCSRIHTCWINAVDHT